MSTSRLQAALARVRNAEATLAKILQEECPIGAIITWRKGVTGAWCRGEVTMHSGNTRIKVRNHHTDAEYWIYASDVRTCEGRRMAA